MKSWKLIYEGFDRDAIPRNIEYYIKRTSHGSTLSRVVHSWVLARSDRARSWELCQRALESDLTDIQGGTTPEGIHLGAMAGSVNILQECYTGLEPRDEVLWFNPCLPGALNRLRMEIRYHGFLVTIADATGHGPSATVIMAMLHSLLHAFPGPHDDPGTILEFINRQMCKKDLAGMFATALLAIIDPPRRTFRYSSAGHHPPLLRESRSRGVRELATNKSVGLAIKPDARFESRLVRLNPLDTLLLYTDGLIEVPDESGNPFGIESLKVTLSGANGGPRQIKDVVNRAVSAHRGRAEMQDDKTFIVIQATARTGA